MRVSQDITRQVGLEEEMHQMLWSEQEKFPQFLCLNTWFSVGGAVFLGGGYVIFRRRSLAGGTGVGLEALQPGVTSFPLCMDSDYQGGFGLLLPCIPHHKGLYPSGTVSLKKPFWSLSCFSSRRLSRNKTRADLDNKLWRWVWCLQDLQYQPLRG